jgi:hypothetical protein
MGVLFDYFRAPSDAVVVELMDKHDGDSPGGIEGWATPVVDLKVVDPVVVLGQLAGFIAGRLSPAASARDKLVWPVGGENDMQYQGPWVSVLADEVRDVLAGLDDARLTEVATAWTGIEEFRHYHDNTVESSAAIIMLLVELARGARDAGDRLYCWICL